MHSTDVKTVHIDIYQFEPTPERSFWTLITSGMSNARQIDPEDCGNGMAPRAEILMYAVQPQGWMFSVLKGLAEMPFDQNTCLHWGHTVHNGSEKLYEKFEDADISMTVDEKRASVV